VTSLMARLLKPSMDWLLVFVPASIVAELLGQPVLVFIASGLAIVPLAGLIGRSTEQIANRVGPRLGGLLNATFGNITELIVCVLLIRADNFFIVKASLIGSILGNLLLVLGISFIVGGFRHKEQHFNPRAASVHTASLLLAMAALPLIAVMRRVTLARTNARLGILCTLASLSRAAVATRVRNSTGVRQREIARRASSDGQASAHRGLDGSGIAEPAVACHGMDQLTVNRDIEGASIPWDQLDARETGAELEHERPREVERLGLVTAFGAVGDLDLVRGGHAATRVAISRSSRTTSAFANFVVSSRIFVSSACNRTRASSAS
jgi:Ca2+/H+ antiporter